MTSQTETPTSTAIDLTTLQETNISEIIDYVTYYGLQILAAVAIFFIGKWVAKRLVHIMDRSFDKAGVDRTLADFIENITYVAAMAMVIIAALAQLGVETTSFAAVIAAAGLAIGLALQGSLSNFAAGVLIILFRPFKAGDYIEAGGTAGTVEEISIFTTEMITPDNRVIIVPNGSVTSSAITNYSTKKTRRIDLVIGVAYDADLKKARQIFEKILEKDDRILKTPAYQIAVSELGASSIDFVVRPWVKAADYWTTRFELLETIKVELDKAGIGIPFPQRDVNLFIREGEVPAKTPANTSKKKAA